MADSTSVASICHADTRRVKTVTTMMTLAFVLIVDFAAVTSVKAFLTVAQLDVLLQEKNRNFQLK